MTSKEHWSHAAIRELMREEMDIKRAWKTL